MAVDYVAAVLGTSLSAATSASVDLSSRSVGEYVIVKISRAITGSATTVPADWTLLQSHSSTFAHFIYGKVLASGDITTLTWSGYTSARTLARAFVFSGVDGTTPVDTSAKGTFGTASAQTIDFGSLSTSEPFIAAIAAFYSATSKTYDVSSQGLTERIDDGSTIPDFWDYCGTKSDHAGGTFAPSTSTNYISAVATYRGGFLVALKAATASADVLDPMGMSGFFGM